MAERKSMLFTELFRAARNKFEIITMFLAVLELIKMKEIIVRQSSQFADIEVIRNAETINPVISVPNEDTEEKQDKARGNQ